VKRLRHERESPTIAVVICTRDRTSALLKTLDSIWTQTQLPDELIVIDDGRLPEAVQDRLAVRCHVLGITWRYERTEAPGLTRSRNRAADIAQSEILQYLDDDVTCDQGLLAEVAWLLRDPRIGAVTATVREPTFSSSPSARLYQIGYCLAGWWRVSPRGRPPHPRPSVLNRPEVVVRARWLSGAAMALRRDIVRVHRFDESLTEYALGEDREMGYRLGRHYWLVLARRAWVVHRRDAAGCTEPRRLGFMTSYNYLRILRKTCRLGSGDRLLIGWNLGVVAAMHAVWAVVGSRRAHLAELRGMTEGLVAAIMNGEAAKPRPLAATRRGGCRPGRGRDDNVATSIAQGGSLGLETANSERRLSVGRPAKRVLFVTNRLEPGGAEWMLLSLVRRLPQYNVQPLIACLKDAGPLAVECRERGIPVFERVLKFKTDATVLARFRRLFADHRVDVIVAAHSGGDRMFWSTLAGRTFGVPVVVWSHWFPMPGVRHFERSNRLLFRWVDAYVALGRRHRAALIRQEGVPAGRITVISNAIEVGRFLDAAPRAEGRRRLGLSDHEIAVAIIANLRPEKRHDVFIEAAIQLAARDSNLRFFIIGDGPHRETVRATAAASGLEPDVLRLLGARDDVAALLSGVDISCLCSELECFSVSMLEAAAAGSAFIGPNCGSIPEFLEHNLTGLVIKPADVGALADAIAELAADADLRRRLAAAAREKVIRDYSTDRMAEAFADLFAGLAMRGVGG